MPSNKFSIALECYKNACLSANCDLLFIVTNPVPGVEIIPPNNFIFVGYDYGNYICESNYYSVLFHLVINGSCDKMIEYSKQLNKYLLAPSLDIVNKVNESLLSLESKGITFETVEPGEEFVSIAVYFYSKK